MNTLLPLSTFEGLRMLTAINYVARCVHVAAEIRLADALGETPTPVATLAHTSGCNADALGRMLRLLSAYGVFSVNGELVSHSEMSRLMRVTCSWRRCAGARRCHLWRSGG